MSFTVEYKLRSGDRQETLQAEYCGMQPDYNYPMYFIRTENGEQIEIPLDNIAYLKFSIDRYAQK